MWQVVEGSLYGKLIRASAENAYSHIRLVRRASLPFTNAMGVPARMFMTRQTLLLPFLLPLLGVSLIPCANAQVKANPAQGVLATPASTPPIDSAGIEFFEKKVRPILVQHCYSCHSRASKVALGNLFLDQRSAMLKGGQGGAAIVPGDPDKSRLVEAIRYSHAGFQMPPKGKLPEAVIADIATWVKRGAPAPDEPKTETRPTPTANTLLEKKRRNHWAWQPIRKVQPPTVKRKAWARNPIDSFILAKLEAKGLSPVGYADRRTLIRRAYYDLVGLPPSPEEVEAFQKDKSPKAWETVIDTLLASPHYGERWGRFWLDIARYGEDQAHSFEPRLYPQGFRYRDWIARSFNADMPYNRFIKEQIAADLLGGADAKEQLPALGFFATGPVYYGDSKMYDQYDDRIDTLTRGVLGLTVACARCHDHKFDPITQKDYYGLAGIFANTSYFEVPFETATAQTANAKGQPFTNRLEIVRKKTEEVDKFVNEHTRYVRERLTPEISKYMLEAWKFANRKRANPNLTAEQFATAGKIERVVLERWLAFLAEPKSREIVQLAAWFRMVQAQDAKADLSASDTVANEVRKIADQFQTTVQSLYRLQETAKNAKSADEKGKVKGLEKSEIALLDAILGEEGVITIPRENLEAVLTGDPKAHYAILSAELKRLQMGPFIHALSDTPTAGNIRVLLRGNPETPGEEAPRRFLAVLSNDPALAFKQGSGRLELANAITADTNPLTPRVMVNRVWQRHFGTGIVRTTNNFGTLGEPPTHPELLDYLTADFIANGWSLKTLHKKMMLSATYQMSSAVNQKDFERDSDNRLFWRMPIRRLEVEAWRDAMLAVAGQLDKTIGGQSVSLDSAENNRRTFYAAISRHQLDAMLRLFDYPDPNVTADSRTNTTVPLQQLFVLNSEFMVREAKAFAMRLLANPKEDDTVRIRRAFLLAYSRQPSLKELALGLKFLTPAVPSIPAPSNTVKTIAVTPPTNSTAQLSRWEQYAQVLLSANEFMYID